LTSLQVQQQGNSGEEIESGNTRAAFLRQIVSRNIHLSYYFETTFTPHSLHFRLKKSKSEDNKMLVTSSCGRQQFDRRDSRRVTPANKHAAACWPLASACSDSGAPHSYQPHCSSWTASASMQGSK
jgi:hypothetical protein